MESYQIIGEIIAEAIEKQDENKLKNAIISAMNLFLEEKITKDELDIYSSYYMTIPIEQKWKKEFSFKNQKLHSVFEELSAIETLSDDKAKENVKRFILYLKNKDYEDINT